MSIKKLYLTASVSVLGIAFTACSHDDFIDENAPVNNLKAEYATNFEKKYGKIDPNQSWDFSTSQTHYRLPSSGSAARTRGGESFNFEANTSESSIVVEKSVLEWMYSNMPKGKNNQGMGKAFYMTVPNNPFTIAPIYQGCATYYWELWMSVDGAGDYKIWSKGQKFSYQDAGDGEDDWTELGTGKEGLAKDKNGKFAHQAVKAPAYTFTNLPAGKAMSFYLKVWKNGSHELGYDAFLNNKIHPNQDKPTTLYSTDVNNCKMISLTQAQKPAAVPEGYDVTIIGCEDGTDKDFEDLVFMVYGKPVPPTERVREIESYEVKRYFMEDLGTTDDFDFNDVVVDVQYNRKKITIKYEVTADNEDGDEISRSTEILPDLAIVRATGGTIDFTLEIGTTTWTKSKYKTATEMWNTGWGGAAIDYEAVLDKPFEVSGYIPGNNNISVTVVDRGTSGQVKTIKFPKKGEAPMIIAVDPENWTWMKERSSVPDTWFTIPEE